MHSFSQIRNLIGNVVKRCAISLAGKDDKDVRVQQVTMNRKAVDGEVYLPFGMSANIPPDSLCVYLQIGGDQGNLVILPDRSQDRVKNLKSGEVAFFNPLTQSRTIYRENGDIEIVTKGSAGDLNIAVQGDAIITATSLTLTGDTTIDGKLTVTDDVDVGGNVDIDGDVDATGDIDGKTVTGSTDVKSGTISLKTHLHFGSPTAVPGPPTPTGFPI